MPNIGHWCLVTDQNWTLLSKMYDSCRDFGTIKLYSTPLNTVHTWCGDHAMALTAAECSLYCCSGDRLDMLQTKSLLSFPPDAKCWWSGDHFSPQTYRQQVVQLETEKVSHFSLRKDRHVSTHVQESSFDRAQRIPLQVISKFESSWKLFLHSGRK